MKFSDLLIELDGLSSTSVTTFGDDSVQIVLGEGRLNQVLVEMTRMQAGALALQLRRAVPEQSADTSVQTDDEWPCEPVEVGDRVVVKEVHGIRGLNAGKSGIVVGYGSEITPSGQRSLDVHLDGVPVNYYIHEWRRVGGDAA